MSIDLERLWDFKNPAETETKFRDLLLTFDSAHQHDEVLQIKTQIARALGLQRKFDEAHMTLEDVKIKLSSQTPIAEIRYHLERGRVFNSSKNEAEARPHFQKAYELSILQKQENLAVDAAHMVAIAESAPSEQLAWNLKAIERAEQAKDPKAKEWLGSLYNNTAWTLHDSGNYKEALELFQKALDFRISQYEPNSIRIAKWSVARALRSLNKFSEALAIQIELEKEFESISEPDGYVFEELAEIYHAMSNLGVAKKYFGKAFEVLSNDPWMRANETKRLQRLLEMSSRLNL